MTLCSLKPKNGILSLLLVLQNAHHQRTRILQDGPMTVHVALLIQGTQRKMQHL